MSAMQSTEQARPENSSASPPARQRFQIQLWELVAAPLLLGLPPALFGKFHQKMEVQDMAVQVLLLEAPLFLGLVVGYFFIHHHRITDPEERSNAWTAGIVFGLCMLVCLPFAAFLTALVFSPSFESIVKGAVVWCVWFITLVAWIPVLGGCYLLYAGPKFWRR